MNLYYIHLGLDYDDYISTNNDLRYEFQQRTDFISDYFSKGIRKHKFKTDGTFNMISISPTEFKVKPTSLVPSEVLDVNLPFDKSRYEKIRGTEDCSYYLELLELGFKKASSFKAIPLETLLNLIKEFKEGNYKNEWLHKKKRFKEEDLEVILICEFNTNYFQLKAIINQLSTKKELVQGLIIRTDVGVSIHQGIYKDIIIDKEIVITDKSDSARIIINKNEVFNNKLDYIITGDQEIKEMLSYKL
jgi:hypothetical protein